MYLKIVNALSLCRLTISKIVAMFQLIEHPDADGQGSIRIPERRFVGDDVLRVAMLYGFLQPYRNISIGVGASE